MFRDICNSDTKQKCCANENHLVKSKTDFQKTRSLVLRILIEACRYFTILLGGLFVLWGVATFVYTPFRILLETRLQMTPGLPPFDWWLEPPDEVIMKVHIFNVTNSEEFLNGIDSKIRVKEVGPLIYREKLTHKNPVFNENGTLTYVANRSAIFLPELNTINMNDTIIMPNLAVLLMPTYLHDASYFIKFGVNILMRRHQSEPFVKTTIQDYLWNVSDPILDAAEKIAPGLVPIKNLGILNVIYSNFEDTVTVYVGSKYGHNRFFGIDKYDGSSSIPNTKDLCKSTLTNSTEGLSYPQYLTKNDTLKYWRKTLCMVANLKYASENRQFGVTGFKYVLIPETYNRTEPLNEDCYKGTPVLPDGISEVSYCYYGMPIAVSFPHYLYTNNLGTRYVDGLEPDEEKHGSFVIVEPFTGLPMVGKARSQINLVMRKLSGFNSKIMKFSDLSLPIAWIEYHQVGIPWYIQWLLYFTVNVVPIGQYFFGTFLIVVGLSIIYFLPWRRKSHQSHLMDNKVLEFETETFLKK